MPSGCSVGPTSISHNCAETYNWLQNHTFWALRWPNSTSEEVLKRATVFEIMPSGRSVDHLLWPVLHGFFVRPPKNKISWDPGESAEGPPREHPRGPPECSQIGPPPFQGPKTYLSHLLWTVLPGFFFGLPRSGFPWIRGGPRRDPPGSTPGDSQDAPKWALPLPRPKNNSIARPVACFARVFVSAASNFYFGKWC